jgi:phenylacetate-coenzyme A ligase PaaK-like adenylate-forming protein
MNALTQLRIGWQSLPEETIRRHQARQLHAYLKDVVLPFSPYYRRLFKEQNLTAEDFKRVEDLAHLPFTSKADLLATPEAPAKYRDFVLAPDAQELAHRPSTIVRAMLHGRAAAKRELEHEFRPVFMTSTTGRSADPVPFVYTGHDMKILGLTGLRLFQVCGARSEYRLLNFLPYAPHLAFWQTHYGATEFGVFLMSTGGGKVMGTDGNLRMLRKIQPDVLIGMPTFIYHVLTEAVQEGVRCPNLKRIVLGGEKVPDGMRRKLALLAADLEAPKIDVVSTYGFTESKCAWAECPCGAEESPTGYHLYPDTGIIEIVDPVTGKLVPTGQPGEIVYTPLDARGSVVLRYRTGDYIDGGLTYDECPCCGRRLPRLVGRISRSSEIREMHLDKLKGTLVDFNELEHILDDAPGIGAWQLELRKRNDDPLELDEVLLHVERSDGHSETELTRDLNHRFAERTEFHPNRILFHDAATLRELQGVGTQLKEQKVVDHRPKCETNGATAPVRPARNGCTTHSREIEVAS